MHQAWIICIQEGVGGAGGSPSSPTPFAHHVRVVPARKSTSPSRLAGTGQLPPTIEEEQEHVAEAPIHSYSNTDDEEDV